MNAERLRLRLPVIAATGRQWVTVVIFPVFLDWYGYSASTRGALAPPMLGTVFSVILWVWKLAGIPQNRLRAASSRQ